MRDEVVPIWLEGDEAVLIDQRQLPGRLRLLRTRDYRELTRAIKLLAVRGAPALGIAGAYGVVLAAEAADRSGATGARWREAVLAAADELTAARPTAVNLSWAVGQLTELVRACAGTAELRAAAERIAAADRAANRILGGHGAALLWDAGTVLTHCNAGALATAGYGTALGVIRSLHAAGRLRMAYVTETRPLRQGFRLSAWELRREGIPVTAIVDGAAAWTIAQGRVGAVVVGADRIAMNGDTANKIGTYGLALAAARHNVPFCVAAPLSTFDRAAVNGAAIPIEERDPAEVTGVGGRRAVPGDVAAENPAFDITPADLISSFITELGVIKPDAAAITALLAGASTDRTILPGK